MKATKKAAKKAAKKSAAKTLAKKKAETKQEKRAEQRMNDILGQINRICLDWESGCTTARDALADIFMAVIQK